MIASVLILCGSVGQVDDRIPPPVRNADGYYASPETAYYHIPGIPVPIRPVELEYWSWGLDLSDEQQAYLKHFVEVYSGEEERIHRMHVQPLWDKSADLASRGPDSWKDPAVMREFADVVQVDRPAALHEILRVEEQFLAHVASILSPDQLSMLENVRAIRRRMRCIDLSGRYPGAEVDLNLVLFSCHEDDFDVPLHQSVDLKGLFKQYDIEVTPFFEKRNEAIIEAMAEGGVITATKVSMGAALRDQPKLRDHLQSERERLGRSILSPERQIHRANFRILAAMTAVLPERTGDELHRRMIEIIYPHIYPDPTDMTLIFRAADEIHTLHQYEREALANLEGDISRRRQAICEQMVDAFLEWRDEWGVTRSVDHGVRENFEQAMYKLDKERRSLAKTALGSLAAIIDPNIDDQLSETVEKFRERVASYRFTPDPRFGY